MNRIFAAICCLAVLLGCVSKRLHFQDSSNHPVEFLIDDLIKGGDLEKKAFFVEYTYPISYYQIEIHEDGNEIPPPSYQSRNELKVICWIGLELFPNNEQTLNHVKSHMEGPTSKAKYDFGKNSINPNDLDLENPYYLVYKPIYNLDSTAIYLEIDYHNQIYGDGRAYVFKLENKSWKKVKFIPTWIR